MRVDMITEERFKEIYFSMTYREIMAKYNVNSNKIVKAARMLNLRKNKGRPKKVQLSQIH